MVNGGEVMGFDIMGGVIFFFFNLIGYIYGWVSSVWGGFVDVFF